jgi:hypothetical protein
MMTAMLLQLSLLWMWQQEGLDEQCRQHKPKNGSTVFLGEDVEGKNERDARRPKRFSLKRVKKFLNFKNIYARARRASR